MDCIIIPINIHANALILQNIQWLPLKNQAPKKQHWILEDIESNHPPLEHVNFDSPIVKKLRIIPTSSQIIPNPHPHLLQTSSAQIPSIPSHRPRCCTTDLPDLAGLEPKGRRLVGLHPLRRALQLQPAACALGDGAGGRSR